MSTPKRIFGTDGVRGTANIEPVTAETALKLGRAVAHVDDEVLAVALAEAVDVVAQSAREHVIARPSIKDVIADAAIQAICACTAK